MQDTYLITINKITDLDVNSLKLPENLTNYDFDNTHLLFNDDDELSLNDLDLDDLDFDDINLKPTLPGIEELIVQSTIKAEKQEKFLANQKIEILNKKVQDGNLAKEALDKIERLKFEKFKQELAAMPRQRSIIRTKLKCLEMPVSLPYHFSLTYLCGGFIIILTFIFALIIYNKRVFNQRDDILKLESLIKKEKDEKEKLKKEISNRDKQKKELERAASAVIHENGPNNGSNNDFEPAPSNENKIPLRNTISKESLIIDPETMKLIPFQGLSTGGGEGTLPSPFKYNVPILHDSDYASTSKASTNEVQVRPTNTTTTILHVSLDNQANCFGDTNVCPSQQKFFNLEQRKSETQKNTNKSSKIAKQSKSSTAALSSASSSDSSGNSGDPRIKVAKSVDKF